MKRKVMDDVSERIFGKHFIPRRTALLRAFTKELQLLVEKCDPASSENLCLYASSDGTWDIRQPGENLPCNPEPYIGVNKKMPEMSLMEWIRFAARWSDSWLMSDAFFMEAGLDADQRAKLFGMINSLRTLVEEIDIHYALKRIPQHVENAYNKRKVKTAGAEDNIAMEPEDITGAGAEDNIAMEPEDITGAVAEDNIAIEPKDITGAGAEDNIAMEPEDITGAGAEDNIAMEPEDITGAGGTRDVECEKGNENYINDVEDNQLVGKIDENICGKCKKLYKDGQFWIHCDACHWWFHGRCVRVTKKQSEDIGEYTCPQCRKNERSKKRKQ